MPAPETLTPTLFHLLNSAPGLLAQMSGSLCLVSVRYRAKNVLDPSFPQALFDEIIEAL
jgi:hypothetical protein